MKQNNYLLFALVLLTLGGCSERKTPKSLAGSWQQKHLTESNSLLRAVASNNQAGMCLNSLFNTTTLKNEVADYESRFTGNPVRGSWQHLDLASLPIPQANFLTKYGNQIGDLANPDSIDFSGCYDLPCIFNRIYEKEDDYIAGYVHYLWYLKFGHYLSLDNKVPDQNSPTPGIYNDKSFEVKDYLYNEQELYGLWRITHLLVEPYTSLTNTHEIQRIPRGESLEGYSPGVCGLASSAGNIRLQDGCLSIYSNKDKGFLYLGIIHEMTHMVDYLQAKQRRSGGWYRSHEQDYLDIAGFYKVEYTDGSGKLVSQWKLREGARTIRFYAATSPVENFADTLAYFRQEGDETKIKIDGEQFDWISSNYFHDESYDRSGNRQRFLKKYQSSFANQILSKVLDCSTTQRPYQSNYFTSKDFPHSSLTPWMLRCLSSEAESMANMITARVKTYEMEGCATMLSRDDQNQWNEALKSSLRDQFAVFVQEITKDPAYLEKVKNFDSSLKDRLMANEAIFQCYQGSTKDNLKNCYDIKVVEIARNAALSLRFPPDQAEEMSALYLASHPYVTVAEDLYLSYRTILNMHDEMIGNYTDLIWDTCVDLAPSDEEKHKGQIFTLRNGYMVSSIYNCINTNLPSALTNMVRSLEYEGERITHPIEELILFEFLEPRVVEILRNKHQVESEKESKDLALHFEKAAPQVVDHLLSDFSWVKNLSDKTGMLMSCRMEALTQINYLPLYHLKRDAFSDMVLEGSCREVMSNKLFQDFITNSQKQVERQVFSKVEDLLYTKAEARALYCRETIPWKWEKTRAVVRIPRKLCLSMGWDDVERAVISELKRDPLAQRFQMSSEDFQGKIKEVQERVRSKIEEKHF